MQILAHTSIEITQILKDGNTKIIWYHHRVLLPLFIVVQYWLSITTGQFRITKPIQRKLIKIKTQVPTKSSITQKDTLLNIKHTKQNDKILYCLNGR